MKITEVAVEHCRLQRDVPIRNGSYVYSAEGHIIVRVRTDDGVEGIGFTHAQPGPDLAVYESARALAGLIVGLDVTRVEAAWDRMYQPKLFGRRGLATRAMSAIDIAMWDAFGKSVRLPLYRLLGGFRTSVPAYLAGGYYVEGKGLEGLAEEMRAKVAAGARVVKMKVGGASLDEDLRRIDAVLGGGSYTPPGMPTDDADVQLTDRQWEILGMVCMGLSNKEIAQRLELSVSTVKFHVGLILENLRVPSRQQAIANCGPI